MCIRDSLMAKALDMARLLDAARLMARARPLDAARLVFLAIARLAELAWMAACYIAIVGLTWCKLLDIAIGPTAGLTWFKLLNIASEPNAAKPLGTARPTILGTARPTTVARLTWCQDIARLTWIVAWCIATAMRSKWLMSCWHQFVTMASVYDARLIRKCEARLACLLACHIMYTNE